MVRFHLLFFLFLVFHLTVTGQELVTDRPDQTESSVAISLRHLQIESGLLMENSNDGSDNYYLLPTTLFRYGLFKDIEIRVVGQLEYQHNSLMPDTKYGFGNFEFGTKIQLLKNTNVKTEIAFLSHLVIPKHSTFSTDENIGTVNKICVSNPLSHLLDLGYNLGYDYFGTGRGNLTYSTVIGGGLSNNLGTYLELFGELGNMKKMGASFDFGFTYLLKRNLQLDCSYGVGLSEKDSYVSIGCSWNIDTNQNE